MLNFAIPTNKIIVDSINVDIRNYERFIEISEKNFYDLKLPEEDRIAYCNCANMGRMVLARLRVLASEVAGLALNYVEALIRYYLHHLKGCFDYLSLTKKNADEDPYGMACRNLERHLKCYLEEFFEYETR